MSARKNYAEAAVKLHEWVTEKGSDKAAMEFLAAWIADDHSLDLLCAETGMLWSVLNAWVRGDEERNKLFHQAIDDRKVSRKERLLDQWWKVANKESEDDISHHDIHRAREALAKAEGVFKDSITLDSGDGVPKSITVTFVDAKDGKPA